MSRWVHGIMVAIFAILLIPPAFSYTLGTSTGKTYALVKNGQTAEFTFYVFGKGNAMKIFIEGESELPYYLNPGSYVNPETCIPYKYIKTEDGFVRACEVRLSIPVENAETGRYVARMLVRGWEDSEAEGTSARVVQIRELDFVVDVKGRNPVETIIEASKPVARMVFKASKQSEIPQAEGRISFASRGIGNVVDNALDNPATPIPENEISTMTGMVTAGKSHWWIFGIIVLIIAVLWLI